ncbi:hypothetical protein GCM10009639_66950 [Kitasatospora putterlickiae]|uniref:Uncharacterized protein n=1 Tax=Kitasatospora putterlickiae TaxID=221725 RepID=A0ABP4J5C0_9ACTN
MCVHAGLPFVPWWRRGNRACSFRAVAVHRGSGSGRPGRTGRGSRSGPGPEGDEGRDKGWDKGEADREDQGAG